MADEEFDPEDLPHWEEIAEDPERFILTHIVEEPDQVLQDELYVAGSLVVGAHLMTLGLDPDTIADQLSSWDLNIKVGPEGLAITFVNPAADDDGVEITIEEG